MPTLPGLDQQIRLVVSEICSWFAVALPLKKGCRRRRVAAPSEQDAGRIDRRRHWPQLRICPPVVPRSLTCSLASGLRSSRCRRCQAFALVMWAQTGSIRKPRKPLAESMEPAANCAPRTSRHCPGSCDLRRRKDDTAAQDAVADLRRRDDHAALRCPAQASRRASSRSDLRQRQDHAAAQGPRADLVGRIR